MTFSKWPILVLAVLCGSVGAFVNARTPSPQAIVDDFSRMVEAHQALAAADKYIPADYIEHDPSTEGGNRAGFVKFIRESHWDEPGNRDVSVRRLRTVASGDLVMVHQILRLHPQDKWQVIVDIFRVQGGKIVEHWDVVQTAPDNPVNTRYPMY